jgi:stage IV sporulation protein FB
MLRFSLFGIPVGVDWFFWLVVFLLGGGFSVQTPDAWGRVIVWMLVVFVSIIVHELGHALAGRHYGSQPAIKLHGFGGLTFFPNARFNRLQSIYVSAAGPLAGLALGAVVLFLFFLIRPDPGSLAAVAVTYGLYVNFFWTFVNLLPIQPLDGGQILREILGPRRLQITSMIGFVLATLVCLWAFSIGFYIMAIMLGLLAFYNLSNRPIEGGVIKN